MVGRGIGQTRERGADLDQQAREREFSAECMHLFEVVREHQRRLALQCALQRGGIDIGVAVAVAADPGGDAEKRRQCDRCARVARREFARGVLVQAWQFFEKGIAEERQAVFDFVGHSEARRAQHARLPDCQHARFEARVDLAALVRRQAALAALAARRHQLGDVEFGVENAFALHLGRVCGEHRHQHRVRKKCGYLRGWYARCREAVEGMGERARLGRGAGHQMGAGAAAVMLVFSDIGQMREVGKRAHHRHRALARQPVQGARQQCARSRVVIARGAHRQLADGLNRIEGVLPFERLDGAA